MVTPKYLSIINPEEFIRELKEALEPIFREASLVIIFGSVARKSVSLFSDVDIFVVTEESRRRMRKIIENYMFDVLANCGFYTYDLVIMNETEFQREKDTEFIRSVLHEGIILWKIEEMRTE